MGKGSEYNLDDFIMFVTHKFQHYTLLKIPNFEQNSTKFPIQVPWAMFPKEWEKALWYLVLNILGI